MSLKTFHIFFIAVATTLSLFMALWGFNDYRLSASGTSLGVGAVGVVGLVCLIPYYRWVQKKFRKIVMGLAVIASANWLLEAQVHACAVCFGDPNSDMTKGLKAGIILLILVVAVVLGGIASVGITWARRAKALEQ